MKNILKFVFVVLTLTGAVVFTACRTKFKPMLSSERGLKFKSVSLDKAKTQAKAAGKPLFVFAHASWCPTCKRMEHEVLAQKNVGDIYNAKLVNVAIDIDSEDGKKLKDAYPIRATPTLFYFNTDGILIKKWEGFAEVPELLIFLAEIGTEK